VGHISVHLTLEKVGIELSSLYTSTLFFTQRHNLFLLSLYLTISV
jgi:hypothetical protein